MWGNFGIFCSFSSKLPRIREKGYYEICRAVQYEAKVMLILIFCIAISRRISAVSNAIEAIDNGMICFIIFCLNCIRHGRNATYEPGLFD